MSRILHPFLIHKGLHYLHRRSLRQSIEAHDEEGSDGSQAEAEPPPEPDDAETELEAKEERDWQA